MRGIKKVGGRERQGTCQRDGGGERHTEMRTKRWRKVKQ